MRELLTVVTFEPGTHCPMGSETGGFVGFVDRVESYHLFNIDEFREKSRTTVAVKREFTTRARARGWATREADRLQQERHVALERG
jgi:hypothetical protein